MSIFVLVSTCFQNKKSINAEPLFVMRESCFDLLNCGIEVFCIISLPYNDAVGSTPSVLLWVPWFNQWFDPVRTLYYSVVAK